MHIRTVLLSLICIGFLLVAGCTSTTPAPAPATPAPVATTAPETPAPPVATTPAAPVQVTTAAAQTTATQPVTAVPRTTSPIKIFTTTQSYSPATAATPGLEMSVITGLDTSTAKYDWSASYGQFVTWNTPSVGVNVVGPRITTNGGKVYWTFSEAPANTAEPVTIHVVVSEANGQELGQSVATLEWKDANTVTVKEIV